MKKIVVLAGVFLVGSVAIAHSYYYENSMPHNRTNSIDCVDCHGEPDWSGQSPLLPNLLKDGCTSCHNNQSGAGYSKTSAPYVQTHHGDCWNCHRNHDVRHVDPDYDVITGTFSNASYDSGSNATTFTVNSYAVVDPLWSIPEDWNAKTGQDRGLILWVTYADGNDSFEVTSANAASITVKGNLTAATDTTFSLQYGQMISDNVNGKPVIFTGPETFTRSGDTDGICQVCHTQTKYWRFDGSGNDHNAGLDCVDCHAHEKAFLSSCDSCHGYPPAIGANDRHNRHYTQLGYDCETCHYETTKDGVNVGPTHYNGVFNVAPGPGATFPGRPADGPQPLSFNYTYAPNGGTCSSNSCHAYWGYSDNVSWESYIEIIIIPYLSGLSSRNSDRVVSLNASRSACYENVNGVKEVRTCDYEWGFGGAGSIIGGNGNDIIEYKYNSTGPHNVSLTMTESHTGKKTTDSITVEAIGVEPPAPTGDFTTTTNGTTAILRGLNLNPDLIRAYISWGDRKTTTVTDMATLGVGIAHTYSRGGRSYDIIVNVYDVNHAKTVYTLNEDGDLHLTFP
ncbi:MAG: hypothetical protein V1706_12300 [Pseudomonadota bacterium]